MSTPTQNSVPVEFISISDDPYIDPLLFGIRWDGTPTSTALTYSFPTSANAWASPYSQLDEPSGLQPFGSSEIAAARSALQLWARYSNISFTETSDNQFSVGDIRFAYTTVSDPNSAAHAYYPGSSPSAGDVWVEPADVSGPYQPGSPTYLLLLHEIGHALGLKHPFEGSSLNSRTLDPESDSLNYTVMSYNLYPGMPIDEYAISYFPTTPMAFDILAIQSLYGPRSFNSGDTQYIYNESQDYFETIYDTGGTDTIILNSDGEFGIIDLAAGAWSSLGNALHTFDAEGEVVKVDLFNVMIFFDTVIENVVSGGGDDDIYGNQVANRIEAGDGHDIVFGDAGADTVLGGGGNDHLYGQSPVGGTDGADSISGEGGSDYIQGNAGNDTLDGGDGSDRVNGGNNDDIIVGGVGNDTINGNIGADTIGGGEGNDSLRGGQGGDSISGGAGNDVLSGDLGADTLDGGSGSDVFTFSGTASPAGNSDRILGFESGVDRFAIGFIPAAVLTGSPQANRAAAAATAQQLLDGRSGDGEVAALRVGSDTYLFYGSGGGATVDSEITLVSISPTIMIGDFG